jgi:hypothetical protein
MEVEQELIALGFRFEIFGKNAVLVTGIPTGVDRLPKRNCLKG